MIAVFRSMFFTVIGMRVPLMKTLLRPSPRIGRRAAAFGPRFNEVAAAAGLSPFHFHRLFSTWAGVTPKDFLQCLTLEHVKQLLLERNNVFDAALDAGLSGPGRLHDLCVALEAASPGEMKNGGAGM